MIGLGSDKNTPITCPYFIMVKKWTICWRTERQGQCQQWLCMFTTSYRDCGHGINLYEQTCTTLNAFQFGAAVERPIFDACDSDADEAKKIKTEHQHFFVIITKSPDETAVLPAGADNLHLSRYLRFFQF